MFGIFTISALLQSIIFMPVTFTLLRLVLPPTQAFMAACLFNLVALAASFICRLKMGAFLYRILTFAISVIIAFLTAGFSLGGLLTLVICVIIFSRVRSDMGAERDIAVQFATGAIILNIILAIIYAYSTGPKVMVLFGNASIFASTVAAVIVFVIKQVDDSRRFGKSSMGISSTQRKNNRLFAGIILAVLMIMGSVGHISSIYKFVLSIIGRVLMLVTSLFAPGETGTPQSPGQQPDFIMDTAAKDPTLFDKIMEIVVNVVGAALIIAGVGFLLYKLTKFIIKLAIRLIGWLRGKGQNVELVSEQGHTDEKQSLINRNIKNMANRLQEMASGLFNREIPYSKLPDDISKVRRLFRYFSNNAKQSGVKITNVSTAREICRDAGGISPDAGQFNALMADCYDRARYNEAAPLPQELRRLEEKLLK